LADFAGAFAFGAFLTGEAGAFDATGATDLVTTGERFPFEVRTVPLRAGLTAVVVLLAVILGPLLPEASGFAFQRRPDGAAYKKIRPPRTELSPTRIPLA
jgi:hypothetical protein